ncbi:uncharacterized protein C8Q71DRAFT_860216 [Rhodofomes roseus]|uniref:F-box domain-containing protein n=1 Tax=Rhodofomes roseus TaxID=34475 RepID=A0ABQ8K811_9APHY|nr:uncharacterized protein C8Q71DRAFT_860216 [Rhodofomes roseus]KAH9833422.1 hypothetical protein C8Q71DRAFT_860216 [Rhodofomes roseus]
MHAALQTDDILDAIFDYLKPPFGRFDHHCSSSDPIRVFQRTLCAAALTCRAFSQPALKSLWFHVNSVDALFYILSSCMKIVCDVPLSLDIDDSPRHQETVWIMDRPVSEKERERFLWYTQCIHIINLQASRRVDPWVFFRLSQENLGTPLTPRLHTMICNQDWPYIDMVVSLLSGPSLRTLALKFNGPEWTIDDDRKLPLNRHNYAAYPLLRNVCASAPDLEKLTVYMCAYPGLLHPIGGMKRLRVLDLSLVWTPINMELVRQLAQLEQLEELALHNSFDGRNLGPCEGFKSVTKLIIRGGIRTIPPLLQALPDLHLRELHLNSPVIEEPRPLQKLVSALSLASRESIESVRIDSLTAGRSLTSAPVSTLIAPFFALPNIRSFYLRADDPLCIADDDLRVIGGKWAKLDRDVI